MSQDESESKLSNEEPFLVYSHEMPTPTKNTFPEENAHNEESSIASEQDQGFADDQMSGGAQSSSFCLNYQSYMDRKPRAKWTKQDTELFYGYYEVREGRALISVEPFRGFSKSYQRGEATKGEQDEDEAVEDREADVAEDHSTLKSDETDDHEDILSSYTRAF
ncbi:hypothetical protein SCA6_017445 [Theobroma cacao]